MRSAAQAADEVSMSVTQLDIGRCWKLGCKSSRCACFFDIGILCVYTSMYMYMHYIVWGTDSWHLSPQSWLKGALSGKPHDLDNTVITGPQHMDSLQF